MKYFLRILLILFFSFNLTGQEDPDFMNLAWEEMDSLKRVALESKSAEDFSFQIKHKEPGGREYLVDYFCRVEKNQLLYMDCSYSYFEKMQDEYYDEQERPVFLYDSTSYSESYFFNKGKWVYCEQYLEEVFHEVQVNDSLDFQRYEAAPWSCHLSFYKGKMFSYFSNGHGLSETDEWEPEAYMRELFKVHMKDVRTKYPKWR